MHLILRVQLLVMPQMRRWCSDSPLMAQQTGSKLLVADGVLHITVEALFLRVGVLDDLCISLLGELGLPAAGGRADRITVELDVLNNPLVLVHTLREAEVTSGVLHVLVELGSIVVEGVLGNIMPLGLRLGGAHNKLVLVHSLSNGNAVSTGLDLRILAEAGDGIVDGVAKRSLLVRELGAAGRRANGVGLLIELKVLNDPLVLVHTLGEAEVTSSVLPLGIHVLVREY
jgi:hypothetical protein